MFGHFRRLSIKAKLRRIILLTSMAALLLTYTGFIVYELTTFKNLLKGKLQSRAKLIGINNSAALIFNDPKASTEMLEALTYDPRITYACVFDNKNKVFATYKRNDLANVYLPVFHFQTSSWSELSRGLLHVSEPIFHQGEFIGTTYLQSDLGEFQMRVREYFVILFIVFVISLAVTLLISRLLERVITGPIIQLAELERVVTLEKNYTVRAVKENEDELGRLIDGFNEMLSEIQKRDMQLQKAHDELEERVRGRTKDLETEILERRRAENTLRQSEARFRTLASHAPVGIFLTDLMGNCLFVNERWCEMAGLSFQDAMGHGWVQALHKEDAERIHSKWNQAIDQKSKFAEEYRFQTFQGKVTWLKGSAVPLHNEAGKVFSYLGTVADITDLKKAEENLLLQSSALEAAANAIVITDREGKIILFNPAFTVLTGYSLQEIKGETLRVLKSGEHDKYFYESLWETILDGKVWKGEIINKRKDGSLYTEEQIITPVRNDAGEITHFVSIKQDITERKRLEHVKDEFLSTVSHELRTPLTSVKEAVINLKEGTAGMLNPEQLQMIEIASRNANRLSRIINDILDLSRLKSGKSKLRLGMTNILRVIQDSFENFKTTAETKKIKLDNQTPAELPKISADEEMILRVMNNLLDNAIKFAKSRVSVSADVIQADALDKTGILPKSSLQYLRVLIWDDGNGIKEADMPSLFNKFVQLHRPIGGSGYKGTGLGLAISKEIIDLHRGKIWVESETGKGTMFIFAIPLGV
jgi:PAS domain S-box-containing protein